MNLRRLKKQLKRQEKKARKNKPRRWIWLVFLLPVLVVALLPVYNQRQLDAPQRLYNQAVKLESLGKVEAAQQLYMQLYQDYPRSGLAAQSLLQSGKIWQYDRRRRRCSLISSWSMIFPIIRWSGLRSWQRPGLSSIRSGIISGPSAFINGCVNSPAVIRISTFMKSLTAIFVSTTTRRPELSWTPCLRSSRRVRCCPMCYIAAAVYCCWKTVCLLPGRIGSA